MGRLANSPPLVRRLLPWLAIAVVAGALYDGWIFYSRWRSARQAENARQEEQAREAQQSLDLAGGGRFQILDFYAVPEVIKRGAQTTICYGVSEATRVRIDPPVRALYPAFTNCFQIAPRKNTEFTLTAVSKTGQTLSRSLRITVRPD
jgi:hypothetical protein